MERKVLEVERADPDATEASGLLEAYFLELRERLAPSPVEIIRRWPDDFRGPGAAVVLARAEGRPVGCAGLRPLGEGVLELKHFFLAREARGRGFGRAMLSGVEEVARERGARRIVLDTAAPLIEAAALYRSVGYADIPRFNDNPVAVAWFGRDLERG
ncbi:MAG TPA: GNAT family N-acetyltransferase [Myxococcaceae bacterium]